MKWENLSLKERSELMGTYLKGGVHSLREMKEHYNKFDKGGPLLSSSWDTKYISKNRNNLDYLYKQHREEGLSHNQTIALLSNYVVESGADPHMNQIGGGSGYGLIQFTDLPRKNNLKNYQPTHNFDGTMDPELQRQARYITENISKLQPGEWRHGGKTNKFNRAKDAKAAFYEKARPIEGLVEIISENYVRPGKPHLNRRKEVASFLDTQYFNNPITDIFKGYKNN